MIYLKYNGSQWIPILIALAILTASAALLTEQAQGVVFYGSVPNYSAVILPNNSYVHQGENISQGNYYDLRGVYGFSGELAHWNNDDLVGQGLPDQIVILSGHRFGTYIDAAKFPVGRWWQWDGQYCKPGSDVCTSGFGNGNAYVFYVTPEQVSLQEKTIVQTSNITISQNGSLIQIPVTYTIVQTYYGTPVPTTAPASSGTIVVPTPEITQPPNAQQSSSDFQDQNGIQINSGVVGAVEVTQKSPVPIEIPMFAIIISLIAFRRKFR